MSHPEHPPAAVVDRLPRRSSHALAGGAQRRFGLLVFLLSGLLPGAGDAGPYDPGLSPIPRYGAVDYGDTRKAYSGSTLDNPAAHRATTRDFGDQGPVPRGIREGNAPGCLVSRYEGIDYFRCTPSSSASPAGSTPTTAPVWQLAPGVGRVRRATAAGAPN